MRMIDVQGVEIRVPRGTVFEFLRNPVPSATPTGQMRQGLIVTWVRWLSPCGRRNRPVCDAACSVEAG